MSRRGGRFHSHSHSHSHSHGHGYDDGPSSILEFLLFQEMMNNPDFDPEDLMTDSEDEDEDDSEEETETESPEDSPKSKRGSRFDSREAAEEEERREKLDKMAKASLGKFSELSLGSTLKVNIRGGVYSPALKQEKYLKEKKKFGKASPGNKNKGKTGTSTSTSKPTNGEDRFNESKDDVPETPLTATQKRRLRRKAKEAKEHAENIKKDPSLQFFPDDSPSSKNKKNQPTKKNGNGGGKNWEADDSGTQQSSNPTKKDKGKSKDVGGVKSNGKENQSSNGKPSTQTQTPTATPDKSKNTTPISNNQESEASTCNLTPTQKRRLARKKAKVNIEETYSKDFDPNSIVDWTEGFKDVSSNSSARNRSSFFAGRRGGRGREEENKPKAQLRELNEEELERYFNWKNYVRKKGDVEEEKGKKGNKGKKDPSGW